jgi:hypothetical protein
MLNSVIRVQGTTGLLVGLVLLCLSCGGGSGSGSGSGSDASIRFPCTQQTGPLLDPPGDVPFQFIDLLAMMVSVTATDITVDIELAAIPDTLMYNQASTPGSVEEYTAGSSDST